MVTGRAKKYNDSLDMLARLEQEGKAFILRPAEHMNLKNKEADAEKLREYYKHGYEVAEDRRKDLMEFLEK